MLRILRLTTYILGCCSVALTTVVLTDFPPDPWHALVSTLLALCSCAYMVACSRGLPYHCRYAGGRGHGCGRRHLPEHGIQGMRVSPSHRFRLFARRHVRILARPYADAAKRTPPLQNEAAKVPYSCKRRALSFWRRLSFWVSCKLGAGSCGRRLQLELLP